MSVVSDLGGLPGVSQPQNPPPDNTETSGVEETGDTGGSGATGGGTAQSGQSGNSATGDGQAGSNAQQGAAAAKADPATSDATSESIVAARVEKTPPTIDGARALAEAAQDRAAREGLIETLSDVAKGWNDPIGGIAPVGDASNEPGENTVLPGPIDVTDTNPL